MYLVSVPVALHRKEEIQKATIAKREIEKLNPEIVVGFNALEFNDFLSDENVKRQIENSRGQSIFEMHAPYAGDNSMLGDCKNLLKALDVASNFNSDVHFHVNYHVGICFHSLEEIRRFSRKQAYETVVENLGKIADKARSYNIEITLENIPAFTYEKTATGKAPFFLAFAGVDDTLQLTKEIGKNVHMLLDTCHLAMDSIMESKLKNTEFEKPFLEAQNIASWRDFRAEVPWENVVKKAYAYHLGNATGLGINLAPELMKKWGEHGVIRGLLSKEQFSLVLSEMKEKKKHATIEIQQNPKTFAEPIEFARWIFG